MIDIWLRMPPAAQGGSAIELDLSTPACHTSSPGARTTSAAGIASQTVPHKNGGLCRIGIDRDDAQHILPGPKFTAPTVSVSLRPKCPQQQTPPLKLTAAASPIGPD